MSISLITIYTTSLQCNCPQCYNTSGLQLSFKQEWRENIWRKRTTEIVREELLCIMCKDPIYSVSWTEDIERLYEYHLKKADKESYNKWKPLAFGMIAVILISILGGLYFLYEN